MIWFDVETTGLIDNEGLPLAQQPSIIEIGALKTDEVGNEIDSFSSLIRPANFTTRGSPFLRGRFHGAQGAERRSGCVNTSMSDSPLPVKYEQACQLLAECRTVDDAKYWHNRAEALAVWSKIHKSERASLEARKLKLHAARRLGEIAHEARPLVRGQGPQAPGPRAFLREHGFTKREASIAAGVALVPVERFKAAVDAPSPPSPGKLIDIDVVPHHQRMFADLTRMHSISQKTTPKEFFDGLQSGNVQDRANKKRMLEDVVDWFNILGQLMP